jgi:hypothetical protein
MRRLPSLLTSFTLAITLLAGGATASGRIYHWVDKAGVPHYSDRAEEVPPAYRDQIAGYLYELEHGGRVNIIEGLNGPGPSAGEAEDEETAYGPPPSAIPEVGQLPGFATDPTEMLERLKGPVMALAVVLTLVVCGFVFAFMAMALLLACRLVGQESPGFKKAYGIVIVQFLAGLVAGPGAVTILGEPLVADLGGALRLQALELGIFLMVHAAVLRGMLCDTLGKSIALALVVNLVVLGLGFLLGLGFVMCAGGAALLGAG